jgi:hypothetical protein
LRVSKFLIVYGKHIWTIEGLLIIGAVLAFFALAKEVSPDLASSLVKEVRDLEAVTFILSIRRWEKS